MRSDEMRTYRCEYTPDRGFRPQAAQRANPPPVRLRVLDSPHVERMAHLRRRRLAARVALRVGLLVILAAGLMVLLFIPRVDAGPDPTPTVSHVVRQGDTLWGLADVHTPPAGDIRRTVALIRAANGMTSALLEPGEVVEIPVGEIPGGNPPGAAGY